MNKIGIPSNDSFKKIDLKSKRGGSFLKSGSFLKRLAVPFAVSALGVLSACSDVERSNGNKPDPDVYDRTRPDVVDSDSVNEQDGNEFDTEVEDSDIEVVEPETDSIDDIFEEANTSILRVFNTAGDINVIDRTNGSEHFLAGFELCAEGDDAEVSLVTLRNVGNYFDLRVNPKFGLETSEVVLSAFDTTLTLNPSQPVVIRDGNCEEVSVSFNSENISSFDSWIRINLVNVESRGLNSTINVVRASDSIRVGQNFPVRGVHTVLNPEDKINIVTNTIGSSSENVEVRRDEQFFRLGSFSFNTNPNSISSLSEARFGFDLNNPDTVLPVHTEFNLYDNILNGHFRLAGDLYIERDGERVLVNSSILSVIDGDVLVWVPEDGAEDVSFGSNLSVNFTGLYAPSELDGVRTSLVGVDTESEVFLRDSFWSEVSDFPLDWNQIRFVDPIERGRLAIVNMQSFNPFRREHFVWNDDIGNIVRDGECFDSNCRLFDGFVRFEGSLNRRNRTLLNGISVITKNNTDNNLNFVYRIVNGQEGTTSYAVHREGRFSVDRFSEASLNLNDLAYELSNDNNQSFRIVVDIDDSNIPETNKFDINRNSLQFVLENIDITQGEEAVPVLVSGRLPAGIGSVGEFELPYEMTSINFNSPALLNAESRTAPVSINERTYNDGDTINLFDSTFLNLHGQVQICTVFFEHDINKVSPPFDSLSLNLDGNIALLTSWSRNGAMFRFVEDGCPSIDSGDEFQVQMQGANPVFSEIQNSLRGRFVLVGIQAVTTRSLNYTVPVIADFDSLGSAIVVSAENPVVGPMITVLARN